MKRKVIRLVSQLSTWLWRRGKDVCNLHKDLVRRAHLSTSWTQTVPEYHRIYDLSTIQNTVAHHVHQVAFTLSGRSNNQVDLVDNPDNLLAGKVPCRTVQRQATWRIEPHLSRRIDQQRRPCLLYRAPTLGSAARQNLSTDWFFLQSLQGPDWPEVSSRESSFNDLNSQCGAVVNTTPSMPHAAPPLQLLSRRLRTACPETWMAGDLQTK